MKVRDIVLREDAKITKSDGSGVEITADDGVKTTLPADKAAALMPDPEKPGEYDLNPQAVASSSSSQPTGPAVGANVEIKTAEDGAEPVEDPNDTPQQIMDKAVAQNPGLKNMIVVDEEGDIDFSETLAKAVESMSEFMVELVKLFDGMVVEADKWMASPEFATECEEPEKFAQDMQDVKVMLAKMKADLPQLQQQVKQGAADLRSIPKAQAKQQMGAIKGPDTARLQELAGLIAEEITDLGNGAKKTTNPDGSYEISDGTGRKTYNAQGKLIKTAGPTSAGIGQSTDHETGNVTTNYSAGPMSTSQITDKTGKPITTKANYDLGIAKVDTELDHRSGIRSNAINTPGMDPNELMPTADIAASKGVDPKKFAAFQQQNPSAVKESPELTAMLKIAGLR